MMFVGQAGLSLNGLTRGRAARALHGAGAEFERLADMVRLLADLPSGRRAVGLKLVDSLQAMLIELA